MKPTVPKILVIDDDARLRELLVRYLTEQGFQVQALTDARDLDKKLQRDPPHLVVLVRAPADDSGMGTLEAVFTRDGEEVARNAQQFSVEPGKFGYRLVRPELEFPTPGTIEARCTITESGSSVVVPLTAIPAP